MSDLPDDVAAVTPRSDRVITARARGRDDPIYHTTQCHLVRRMLNPKTRPRLHLDDSWEECHYCQTLRDDNVEWPGTKVDTETRARVRRRLLDGDSLRSVVDDLGIDAEPRTVRRHVRGERGTGCDVPPLRFDKSADEWRPRDRTVAADGGRSA